jgi:Leucine-rich repeat (LRR) protein
MKRFLLGLEEVTKLTQLESLKLHGNQLTDLSPLAKLTMLEQLHLNNNPNLTPDRGRQTPEGVAEVRNQT